MAHQLSVERTLNAALSDSVSSGFSICDPDPWTSELVSMLTARFEHDFGMNDWLYALPLVERRVHSRWLLINFRESLGSVLYVDLFLRIFTTAMEDDVVRAVFFSGTSDIEARMMLLFDYIDKRINKYARFYVRESTWAPPYSFIRGVRKLVRRAVQLHDYTYVVQGYKHERAAERRLQREMREKDYRRKAQEAVIAAYKAIPKSQRKAARAAARGRSAREKVEYDEEERFQRVYAADIARAQREAHYDNLARVLARLNMDDFQKQGGGAAIPIAAVGAFTAFLFRLSNQTKKVADSVSSASNNIAGEVTRAFQAMSGNIRAAYERCGGSAIWKVALVMVTLFIIVTMKFLSAIMVDIIVGCLEGILGPMWGAVCEVFRRARGDGGFQTQGGASFLFPGALSAAFCMCALGDGHKWQDTLARRLSFFPKITQGIDAFAGWFTQAMQECVNWLLSHFTEHRVKWVSDSKQHIADICARVDALDVQMDMECGGSERVDSCVAVMRDVAGLREVYRGTDMEKVAQQLYTRCAVHLSKVAGALNARNNFRQEPVMVMLRGDSGIGKTAISMPFVAACLIESGEMGSAYTPENILKEVWSKSTSEYWNGYVGQKAIVIDDVFQTVQDHTTVDNDFISIIRMVGSFALPLNMADLASKGREYFRSNLIFSTSNVENVGNFHKCVYDETAVLRRISHPYQLILKKEYKTEGGFLDRAKFAEELRACKGKTGHEAYPWHMWCVRRWNLSTSAGSGRAGDTMSVVDLIKEVGRAMRTNRELHNSTHASVVNLVEGFTSQPDQDDFEIQAKVTWDGCKDSIADIKKSANHAIDGIVKGLKQGMEHMRKNGFTTLKWAVIAAACTFALSAAFHFIRQAFVALRAIFFPSKKTSWERQSNRPERGKRVDKVSKATSVLRGRVSAKDIDALYRQEAYDTGVVQKVYRDTYKLCVCDAQGVLKVQVGQVTAIKGHVFMQPAHFTESVVTTMSPTDSVVFVNSCNPQFNLHFTGEQYVAFPRSQLGNMDVELFRVPATLRSFKTKDHHFLSEKDLQYAMGKDARLDVCNVEDTEDGVRTSRTVYMSDLAMHKNMSYSGYTHTRGWRYKAATEIGDCGAVLSLVDPTLFAGRIVLGVHTGGWPAVGECFAPIVTREMIDVAYAALAKKDIVDCHEQDIEVQAAKFGFAYCDITEAPLRAATRDPTPDCGSFVPLFRLSKGPVFASQSKYYETKLYGEWGTCPVRPAHLGMNQWNGEMRFPMLQAYEPYMTEVRHMDYEWLDQAVHDAMRPFTDATRKFTRMALSFEEAVAGVPELGLKSLPRNTSPGFPWIMKYKHGKKEIFGFEDAYQFDTEGAIEVQQRVVHVVEEARKGRRCLHICSDFPKDELRSHEKVDANKTRMISGTAVDYSIACRMYFGAFVTAMNSTHSKTGLCPGICVYKDWAQLRSFMTHKGDKVFDGDFKGFDASQQPGVLKCFLKYINSWYNNEDNIIREVLFEDLLNSRHLCGRGRDQTWLMQWNKGLPSGHFLTSTINSMYSMTVLAAAYGNLTGKWGCFWDDVHAATLGDDNLVNPSDGVIDVFNQVTVAQFVKTHFHMEYTAGRKGEELVPYLAISQVSFLRRRFAEIGGQVVCPLEKESFLYVPYYCKNRLLESEILPDNLEFALEELSMHADEDWELYAPIFVDVLARTYGRTTRYVPTKGEYLRQVLSRTENTW